VESSFFFYVAAYQESTFQRIPFRVELLQRTLIPLRTESSPESSMTGRNPPHLAAATPPLTFRPVHRRFPLSSTTTLSNLVIYLFLLPPFFFFLLIPGISCGRAFTSLLPVADRLEEPFTLTVVVFLLPALSLARS